MTSALPPQCHGTAGLLIPCPNRSEYFTFTYQDWSRAFGKALTIKMYLQCRAYTWALQREKSISPLFPDPIVAVVTNDWCINILISTDRISVFLSLWNCSWLTCKCVSPLLFWWHKRCHLEIVYLFHKLIKQCLITLSFSSSNMMVHFSVDTQLKAKVKTQFR